MDLTANERLLIVNAIKLIASDRIAATSTDNRTVIMAEGESDAAREAIAILIEDHGLDLIALSRKFI